MIDPVWLVVMYALGMIIVTFSVETAGDYLTTRGKFVIVLLWPLTAAVIGLGCLVYSIKFIFSQK